MTIEQSPNVDERRIHPRHRIEGPVIYWPVHNTEDVAHGELYNVSETGAYLIAGRDIAIGVHIGLAFKSDEPDKLPLEIKAKVVRKSWEGENLFGYGCRIEQAIDIN